jgi:hypothetical protein
VGFCLYISGFSDVYEHMALEEVACGEWCGHAVGKSVEQVRPDTVRPVGRWSSQHRSHRITAWTRGVAVDKGKGGGFLGHVRGRVDRSW